MAEYDMNHLDYKATETERIAEDDAKYHIFSENWKYGYKKDDVVVIPAIYDDAMDFSEGLAAVKLNDNYGFIDYSGNEVIPFKYDFAWDFFKGMARVEIEGKWGYIDRIGNEVVPIKYDYADYFSEGLSIVKLQDKWGYIDKTGKEVIPN